MNGSHSRPVTCRKGALGGKLQRRLKPEGGAVAPGSVFRLQGEAGRGEGIPASCASTRGFAVMFFSWVLACKVGAAGKPIVNGSCVQSGLNPCFLGTLPSAAHRRPGSGAMSHLGCSTFSFLLSWCWGFYTCWDSLDLFQSVPHCTLLSWQPSLHSWWRGFGLSHLTQAIWGRECQGKEEGKA